MIYDVHSIIYTVNCTVYSVHCIVYIIPNILINIHSKTINIKYIIYNFHRLNTYTCEFIYKSYTNVIISFNDHVINHINFIEL